MNIGELLILLLVQHIQETCKELRGDPGIQSDYALCAGDKR